MVMTGWLRHRIYLQKPTRTADGAGGMTEAWGPLDTAATEALGDGTAERGTPEYVRVEAATPRNLERIAASQVRTTLTHLVTCRYRTAYASVSILMTSRIRWERAPDVWVTLLIRSVQNPDGQNIELVLACEEWIG